MFHACTVPFWHQLVNLDSAKSLKPGSKLRLCKAPALVRLGCGKNVMRRAVCKVTSFAIVGPYTLSVGFDDGTFREIDFSPILQGGLYGPLRDLRLFEQVMLDGEVHTLAWPNGADFDPATLCDWPSQPGCINGCIQPHGLFLNLCPSACPP